MGLHWLELIEFYRKKIDVNLFNKQDSGFN